MTSRDPAQQAATAGARPVLLARFRSGSAAQAICMVHLVPLPLRSETADTLGALCGAKLSADQLETVTPGEGAPCTLCLVIHLSESSAPPSSTPPPADPGAGPGAAEYHAWGWPVTQHRDQIWLRLGAHAVALIIPTALAADVTAILSTRRCPAPVLAHPCAPHHWIVLGGESYGVPLPWPPGVHRATGTLPLPPTVTPYGPLTWVHPPVPDALRLCREIDIFGAVYTLGKVGGGP